MTQSTIQKTSRSQLEHMYPSQIWTSESEVVIAGVRKPRAEDKRECYLVLPIETLKLLQNKEGFVQLNQLYRLKPAELETIKIVDGEVPAGFELISEGEYRSSLYADKTTSYHPEELLKLPLTIPLDVVTLPAQILIYESFKNVH